MKTGLYRFIGLVLIGIIISAYIILGPKSCQKQPEPLTPSRSEAGRVKAETENKVAQAKFSADSAFEQRILKGVEKLLQERELDNTLKTEKALQSFLKYQRNPTPENCHHALTDCQHENQAKAAVIGTQTEKIGSLKRTVKADSTELNRYRMVNHLLNESLRRSNEGWQQTSEELLKAKKPKRLGIGLQGGYGATETGLTPYVGVGVSYNFVRF